LYRLSERGGPAQLKKEKRVLLFAESPRTMKKILRQRKKREEYSLSGGEAKTGEGSLLMANKEDL